MCVSTLFRSGTQTGTRTNYLGFSQYCYPDNLLTMLTKTRNISQKLSDSLNKAIETFLKDAVYNVVEKIGSHLLPWLKGRPFWQ